MHQFSFIEVFVRIKMTTFHTNPSSQIKNNPKSFFHKLEN